MAKKRIVVRKVQEAPSQLSLLAEIEGPKYTEEQQQFVSYDGDQSIILAATAGAGKTYSCVQRLKELLKRGVDPSKIIFFSFTKAATEELQHRIGDSEIKITTIHAFCLGILAKVGKFKKIATFYDFIQWFQDKYKPKPSSTSEEKTFYYDTIGTLYEDADFLSSAIAAFKLQSADGLKCMVPSYISEYSKFLRESKSRDFSDMLIEVRDLLREDKWLKMFRNQYEYIFVDEYQDTSTIQLQILLSLNAKYYYMIGDRNQSIYGYSGANCSKLEEMLKERRETLEMSLSINFRSDKKIVENSNKFSSLKAVANSQEEGFVDDKLMLQVDELVEILQLPEQVAVLVRTNDIIKKLELLMLKRKMPIKYFNFITPTDLKNFNKGEVHASLKSKLVKLKDYFDDERDIMHFIERNKNSNKFITTIHKSKGREFDTCVVINSIAPELLEQSPNFEKLTAKQLEKISFDPDDDVNIEPRNIHYVAVSRSKHKLYFMVLLFKD
jgi:superfamily I DNA/RNA helicase